MSKHKKTDTESDSEKKTGGYQRGEGWEEKRNR